MSAKNELQELMQKNGMKIPIYTVKSKSGPAHSPCFVCCVTVDWKGQTLTEEADGKNKKDAEQSAAKKMLTSIYYPENINAPALYPATSTGCGSPQPDPPCLDPISPSSAKSDLQSFLQKKGFPLPEYTMLPLKGPSHQRRFTAKVTLRNRDDSVFFEIPGEEKTTKKEAETSAAQKAMSSLPSINTLASFSLEERFSPPREWIEPETDLEIYSQLANYRPKYTHKKADGVFLCLGSASVDKLKFPVAAHGKGTSEQDARREAALNLLHNIHKLLKTS